MSRGNPIIEYILKKRIKYTSGPQWLHDNILKDCKVIAVSGTHGKTTTTAMIVHILKNNKINPSYLIGGSPKGDLDSVALTRSEYFIIEADEYDTAFFDKRSKFVHYNPLIAVVNNIEYDHADIFSDVDGIIKSFHHMVRLIPPHGTVILNKNSSNTNKLLRLGCWSNVIKVDDKKLCGDFNLIRDKKYHLQFGKNKYEMPDNIIGHHNYVNAAAAIAACKQIGVPIKNQIKSLSSFKGVSKRTDLVDEVCDIKIYDDFAHHPTAIKSSISSIKDKFKGKKLLTIFVPSSNSMMLGIHNEKLISSLQRSNSVLVITKQKDLKTILKNNIKISVIESEAQIGQYLEKDSIFDLVLILSNRNTDTILSKVRTWIKKN